MLLDADLDPVIAANSRPDVRMVEIPVRQRAEIIQVCDRSCSMRFLLGGEEDDQRRAQPPRRGAAVHRPRPGRGRAVRELKAALDADDAATRRRRRAPGRPARPRRLQHHDVAIVAGHLEPSVEYPGALRTLHVR